MTVWIVIRKDLKPVVVAVYTTELAAERYVNMLNAMHRDRYSIHKSKVSS